MLIKALHFAATKHQDQTRKCSGLPYVIHPIIVSFLLAKYKISKNLEELQVAALLHDTLEDTEANFIELATEFSPMVASLVLELTSDSEEIKRLGKNGYFKIKLLGMSKYALTLKLVDRLSNIMDEPSLQYSTDTLELIKHIENNRILTKTQENICNEIKHILTDKK